mmetsp:Transcript_26352/g.40273  ORF Transcript_26352/g.40273 Transcript_26352/m.40273 type:complete len:90 (+) Transcript_26352:121-390(+)
MFGDLPRPHPFEIALRGSSCNLNDFLARGVTKLQNEIIIFCVTSFSIVTRIATGTFNLRVSAQSHYLEKATFVKCAIHTCPILQREFHF